MKNTVVVGAQFGDEGKAKITDLLASNADFIITGEVLNQRPMSQNRQALNTVKKEIERVMVKAGRN